jgi:hypothetical protein
MSGSTVNSKIYLHEYIDIIGQNRAKYMHHMTANWNPIGMEERKQLCAGLWGTVGSTGRWPETVNLWELDGFDGIAASFSFETGRPSQQDEKLEKWWAEAANFRRGGFDRLMLPAPWCRTVTELCEQGVKGETYAHETIRVDAWTANDFLAAVHDLAVPAFETFGIEVTGAYRTAMRDDSEVTLIYAFPTWQVWADYENAWHSRSQVLARWQTHLGDRARAFERFAMVEAPLSPMRLGRQPDRSDRVEGWSDL